MRKVKDVSTEEKVILMIKRTGSDINQLFSELYAELSEEYLKEDNSIDAKEIKEALKIVSDQQDNFLAAVKKAVFILRGGSGSEQESAISTSFTSTSNNYDDVDDDEDII